MTNSTIQDVLNNAKANNALEEELVEDELPTVEDQTNVLPANNMDNSQVVLSEVNPFRTIVLYRSLNN